MNETLTHFRQAVADIYYLQDKLYCFAYLVVLCLFCGFELSQEDLETGWDLNDVKQMNEIENLR